MGKLLILGNLDPAENCGSSKALIQRCLLPWSLLEMKILLSHPRPINQKLHFTEIPRVDGMHIEVLKELI